MVYKLADPYFAQYMTRIQAVTTDQVRKAAAKYIDPARQLVVVVGDRKVIEAPIRALNFASIEIKTIDEALPK